MNKAGFLPSAGVVLSLRLERYYEPLRLPARADLLSFPYTGRSVVSPPPWMDLQHWATNLQEHADPATPEVDGATSVIPAPIQRPSPSDHGVGFSNFVYEATHGFTYVTACSFAVRKLTTPRCRDAASSCYRGVRTIPRTGLQPARLVAVTAYGQTPLICTYLIYLQFGGNAEANRHCQEGCVRVHSRRALRASGMVS